MTDIVRVRIEEGRAGLFYATSPDLKGLLVADASLDGMDEALPKAIVGMYAVCGRDVAVLQAVTTPGPEGLGFCSCERLLPASVR